MTAKLDDSDRRALRELLADLVAIPSVNVDGGEDVPEERIGRYIEAYVSALGMSVERVVMPPGRPHILARWPGAAQDRTLVLTVHMDTVGVDGMDDPFGAVVRDGRMFGRGTCDTKGALAAYLWALGRVASFRDRLPWSVVFLGVCDEERGCLGSRWLVERGVGGEMMIVGEPTDCRVACRHKGRITAEVNTFGRAAHASLPSAGVNAIYGMGELIATIRDRWLPRLADMTHPDLGPTVASVTRIDGGVRDNIVPDRCRAMMDVRTVPGHDGPALIDGLKALLDETADGADWRYTLATQNVCPALATDPACEPATMLLNARRAMGLDAEPTSLPFLTDASHFSAASARCVVFGPGDIAQAHAIDEYIDLDQLYRSAAILLTMFEDQAG